MHLVGCPRIDLVADVLKKRHGTMQDDLFAGASAPISIWTSRSCWCPSIRSRPSTAKAKSQITATLEAVRDAGCRPSCCGRTPMPGSEDIARGMRKWREQGLDEKMHFFKNLPIDIYVRLMRRTACLVGNSSSGIREGAFIGTPVVNIGSRQAGRERGHNVIDSPPDRPSISAAIKRQIDNGQYDMDSIYGDGKAGERIANVLVGLKHVNVQKRITF